MAMLLPLFPDDFLCYLTGVSKMTAKRFIWIIVLGKPWCILAYSYNYTVILTYIGMLTGFIGIVYAFEKNTFGAVICLMIAGFCDMFDGTIASTKERTQQEKCFGIQIDSFSDLICFGALPAIIVYSQSKHNQIVLMVCSNQAVKFTENV